MVRSLATTPRRAVVRFPLYKLAACLRCGGDLAWKYYPAPYRGGEYVCLQCGKGEEG